MAWSAWQPAAPQNLQASLAAGGTLLANTTYYVRVAAIDSMGAGRRDLDNQQLHVYSPYSAVASITTGATQRSIALTWDAVTKQASATEVDAYDVLATTDPAQFDAEHAVISCPQPGKSSPYYFPSTYDHSYTLTAPPSLAFHRIPSGLPYIVWDGAGTATLPDLYAWLHSNGWGAFMTAHSTPFGTTPHIRYQLVANLVIKNNPTGYALSIEQLPLELFGSLNLAGVRVKLQRPVFSFYGNSKSGGYNFGVNAAGSTVESCVFEGALGVNGGAVHSFPRTPFTTAYQRL